MKRLDAQLCFTPETSELRHLPEGPYRLPDGRVSWVAIQHGPLAKIGSLNLLDLHSGANQNFPLPGRPGFAFPTDRIGVFVVGMEREVVLFDLSAGVVQVLADGVDAKVDNTIINDGMVFDDCLIFGCKDLEFATKKAGLYLLKPSGDLLQLADDQICSNGKAIRTESDRTLTLFDICSCSHKVTASTIDLESGTLSNSRTVIDLTGEVGVPDGMIMTPDEQSLIVAIFHPSASKAGEARQYSIATGELEVVWRCDASPRVTCPQLVQHADRVQLLLTTADEGMPAELRADAHHAGCLFLGETEFDSLNECPLYPVPARIV